MACELLEYCRFFNDNKDEMPKTAEYIKSRLCYGAYENCNRYKMYKKLGGENVDCIFTTADSEEMEKVIESVRKGHLHDA